MLRPYQFDLVSQVKERYAMGIRSVCMKLATGGGKSITAATLAVEQAQAGQQALYLVHREELVDQIVETLTAYGLGPHVGIIGAGHPITPWAKLQVGMIQTVVKRLDALPWLDPSLTIIDEAHHVRAESWEKVAKNWPNANILGLTATPSRLDGKGLGTVFETLIEGPSVGDLVAMGYLCRLKCFSVEIGLDLRGVKKLGGDLNAKEADLRVTGPVIANAVKNTLRLARYRRFIHYAHSIRHSKLFAEQMREHGVRCEHIDGNMSRERRREVIRMFREGSVQSLSNVGLISEGLDVPECDCVIFGCKTESTVKWLQGAGRAMRPKEDGRDGMLVDLAGNLYNPHLPPEVDLEWSLDGGVERDVSKAIPKKHRICENCGFINPVRATECELCGHIPETPLPTEVDIELVEVPIVVNERKRARQIGRDVNMRVSKSGGDPAILKQIQSEYGYPDSVVEHWKKLWAPFWNYGVARI